MAIDIAVSQIQGSQASEYFRKTFFKEEVTIGRASQNDIVLSEARVSGRHAKLVYISGDQPKVFLVDLGSSNGTFLEERRLEPNEMLELQVGQRFVIAGFVLMASVLDVEATGEIKVDTFDISREPSSVPLEVNSDDEQVKLKQAIHEQLISRLDLARKDITQLSNEDLRRRSREVVEQILVDLRWDMPAGLDREVLIKQVLDEALGLGPLEELLDDEGVSEIMVNSVDHIYAEREGVLDRTDLKFSSEQAVLSAIERIIAPIGRRVDESSPLVDARLSDGSRVNAVIRPVALNGPCITIRKFAKEPLRVDDLVSFGSFSQGMANFLQQAVENRLNIVISGGTGSGKTTLLNVISSFIPEGQRLVTVEDAAELQLPQEHIVSFETRPPNLEGKGSISMRDLIRNSLRMRPDRIIVGECRGAEALDMLQAMNTGHDGSLTTAHANSPGDMISRLETMVLTAGLDLPVRAIREQISSAVDLIVQQTRFSCGTRKVTAITEVVGMDYDEGTVALQDIFVFRQDGYGGDGKVKGRQQATGYIPKFFQTLQEQGRSLDASVFSPDGNA